MSKTYAAVLIAALAAVGGRQRDVAAPPPAASAPAAAIDAGVQTNVAIAFQASFYVSCANGGLGEYVALQGLLHNLYLVTTDAQGYAHVKIQQQPQGVSGVGQTTGDNYRGTGVTEQVMNTRFGSQSSFENIVNIIGQGPGNNFKLHQSVHVNVASDGRITADHGTMSITCR